MSLALPVVYADNAVVVVDKPSGLPAQSPRGGGDNVYDRILKDHPRAALHHRLDTPASGLMLVSVNPRANKSLSSDFQNHRISRAYVVVVLGDPGEQGQWERPLDGKRALTHFVRQSTDGRRSVLRVHLDTGRMHQIRRHASDAGHPVLGDRRYGGAAGSLWSRLALHAAQLGLDHPLTKRRLELEAAVPDDLTALVDAIG